MEKPLVSIIICCHNRAHLLPRTMESVFAQEYSPVEIVVIDDGSTDNTPELMASYGDKIRYYRQKNQGVAIARTKACCLAEGEYIAFIDDDDLMPPKRISKLFDALYKYPNASFAVGDWACIDSEGNMTGRRSNFQSKLGAENKDIILIKDGYRAILSSLISPVPHTTLFRKADGERIGWFDTRFFHSCEDTDFFARCAQLGPVVYIPELVSLYRQANGSLCSDSNSILVEYSRILLLEKHLENLKNEQRDMKDKLQSRVLSALKQIAFLQQNSKTPNPVSMDYMKRGKSLLDVKRRLALMVYNSVKLPIRKLLIGMK